MSTNFLKLPTLLKQGNYTMSKRRGRPSIERPPGIGRFLTQAREAQGKTQQQMARRLKKSKSIICKIERGHRTDKSLRGLLLYDLAKAYGVKISDLLKAANWPQLPLLDTTEKERKQLIRYLMKIRGEKK